MAYIGINQMVRAEILSDLAHLESCKALLSFLHLVMLQNNIQMDAVMLLCLDYNGQVKLTASLPFLDS